jgi:iron complex transport system substrate-binding protein
MITRVLNRRLPALTIAAVLAAAVAGCGSSPASTAGAGSAGASSTAASGAFPVMVMTANGAVHISKRPVSIVSVSPTATEMLYAIGAGHQVSAVDQDSDYPPQAPRTKLSYLNPDVEAIVARKPDLVVISNETPGLAKRLAGFSIPVLDLPAPDSLSGVYAEFDQLGRATGNLAGAEREAASLRGQISQIKAAVPRRSAPVTYYYELDQTYFSVTSDTFVGRLLGLLGMKSIADSAKGAAAAGGYPQLSAEYILKANPDYVILADTICCHQDLATVLSRPGWAGLAAVKSGHVIPLNDDIASRWGPRIVDLLRVVLAALRRDDAGMK